MCGYLEKFSTNVKEVQLFTFPELQRVMPSSYFILLRYFLRVDNVLVRINDTRIFHDFTTNYILREFTNKESSIHKLNLPLPLFADPNLISSYLPLNKFLYEKLIFPKATEDV